MAIQCGMISAQTMHFLDSEKKHGTKCLLEFRLVVLCTKGVYEQFCLFARLNNSFANSCRHMNGFFCVCVLSTGNQNICKNVLFRFSKDLNAESHSIEFIAFQMIQFIKKSELICFNSLWFAFVCGFFFFHSFCILKNIFAHFSKYLNISTIILHIFRATNLIELAATPLYCVELLNIIIIYMYIYINRVRSFVAHMFQRYYTI